MQEQCINLFGNSIVQREQATRGRPRINGFVYDIENGKLKHLDNIDFSTELKQYGDIYTVADFKSYEPLKPEDEETVRHVKQTFKELSQGGDAKKVSQAEFSAFFLPFPSLPFHLHLHIISFQ